MDIARAHTAEHIFMRALTNIKPDLRVLRVEHVGYENRILVSVDDLTWDDVIKATYITNMVILDDRSVRIEYFNSMEEAKNRYPDIRAYEERIVGRVRVVVIDGYDVAACMMPHVDRTGKSYIFLPLSLNRAKRGRYLITYSVYTQALDRAIRASMIIDKLTVLYSADIDEILDRAQTSIEKIRGLNSRVKRLTRSLIENAPVDEVDGFRVKFIIGSGMDMGEAGYHVSRWVRGDGRIAILVNIEPDKNLFLLASSDNVGLDLRRLAGKLFHMFGGRGGGRSNWVMGYLERIDGVREAVIELIREGSKD